MDRWINDTLACGRIISNGEFLGLIVDHLETLWTRTKSLSIMSAHHPDAGAVAMMHLKKSD